MSFTRYSKTRRTKSNFTVGVPREDLENPALGLGTHSSYTPAPREVIRPLIYIIALGELTVSFYFVSQTTVTTIFFLPPIGSHSARLSTLLFSSAAWLYWESICNCCFWERTCSRNLIVLLILPLPSMIRIDDISPLLDRLSVTFDRCGRCNTLMPCGGPRKSSPCDSRDEVWWSTYADTQRDIRYIGSNVTRGVKGYVENGESWRKLFLVTYFRWINPFSVGGECKFRRSKNGVSAVVAVT